MKNKYNEYYLYYFSYSMAVLVRLGRHVMSANDTGSFLSMTYGSALVHVKRNYDKLMHAHLKSIQDVRIIKKSKCGILPFVANFEVIAILFMIFVDNLTYIKASV